MTSNERLAISLVDVVELLECRHSLSLSGVEEVVVVDLGRTMI
jgi:hypothetical protein